MRSDTSVKRTLVAALLAAGLWPASALLLGPALGLTNALGVHLVGALALHVATLEAHATRRFARGLAALLLGACVLALAPAMPERGIGLALVLGLCRSGASRSPGAAGRALALEAVTLLGGLLAARAAAAPGLAGTALAVFAFGLVQTLHDLVLATPRGAHPGAVDPFDAARTQLDALLREEGRVR